MSDEDSAWEKRKRNDDYAKFIVLCASWALFPWLATEYLLIGMMIPLAYMATGIGIFLLVNAIIGYVWLFRDIKENFFYMKKQLYLTVIITSDVTYTSMLLFFYYLKIAPREIAISGGVIFLGIYPFILSLIYIILRFSGEGAVKIDKKEKIRMFSIFNGSLF